MQRIACAHPSNTMQKLSTKSAKMFAVFYKIMPVQGTIHRAKSNDTCSDVALVLIQGSPLSRGPMLNQIRDPPSPAPTANLYLSSQEVTSRP